MRRAIALLDNAKGHRTHNRDRAEQRGVPAVDPGRSYLMVGKDCNRNRLCLISGPFVFRAYIETSVTQAAKQFSMRTIGEVYFEEVPFNHRRPVSGAGS